MQVLGLQTPILEGNFNFEKVITEALERKNLKLNNGDVLVISSKIVALSEDRLQKINNEEEFQNLVKSEADYLSPYNQWLSIKDGIFIASAGIDKSNVPEGFCILWPKDSYSFAENLRKILSKKYNLKNLGVVIADSQCTPLRMGVVGISLGYAGFVGVEDLRGENDLYGKELKHTRRNIADSLCSTALLVMGESNESTPMALIRNAKIQFTNKKTDKNAVKIPLEEDLFYGILKIN